MEKKEKKKERGPQKKKIFNRSEQWEEAAHERKSISAQ